MRSHDVEIAWHFDERCAVRAENATLRATRGMRGLCLVCDDSTLVPDLCAGRDDPPAGWVSRRFDRKEPATCAVFSVRSTCRARVCSEATTRSSVARNSCRAASM